MDDMAEIFLEPVAGVHTGFPITSLKDRFGEANLRAAVSQHRLRNPLERKNFFHGTEKDRFARHAGDHPSRLVPGNGECVV